MEYPPSTTTFLVLMVTLTPSGISSNSSEWLLRNCQLCSCRCIVSQRARPRFAEMASRRRIFRGCENSAARRVDDVFRRVDVHVLHLGGCCGLAMSTEVARSRISQSVGIRWAGSLTILLAPELELAQRLLHLHCPTSEHQHLTFPSFSRKADTQYPVMTCSVFDGVCAWPFIWLAFKLHVGSHCFGRSQ